MNTKILVYVSTLTASLVAMQQHSSGQSQYKRFGNGEAVSFKTKMGEWTAFHVGTAFKPTHASRQLDIQFKHSPSSDPMRFTIGDGEPHYFIDRRGNWHKVIVVDDQTDQWVTNIRFYSGESGSPIFSGSGRVVGIVLGNLLDRKDKKWKGRVGKISRFVSQVPDAVPNKNNRNTQGSATVSIHGVFE